MRVTHASSSANITLFEYRRTRIDFGCDEKRSDSRSGPPSGSLELVLAHHRTRVLTLSRDIAVNELDDRNRCCVRLADAGLDHPGVSAVAAGVARAENVE